MRIHSSRWIVAALVAIGLAVPAWGQAAKKPSGSATKPKGETQTAKDKSEAPAAKHKAETKAPAKKVDLNAATAEELEELPGIGPARSAAIIKARPFKAVEDLKHVPGISAKVYDDLVDHVRVSDTATKPATARRDAAKPRVETAAAKPNTETATKPVATPKPATAAPKPKADVATEPAAKPKATAAAKAKVAKAARPPGAKINLNTATQEELEELPDIGPVRSAAIMKHRPFNTIEDIMKVEGIKEGIFSKIKDQITVK